MRNKKGNNSGLRGIQFTITILLVLILLPSVDNERAAHSATQEVSTGVIVPMFSYSYAEMNEIIQAKSAYPAVPIIVVINPMGGPGNSFNSSIASGVKNMQEAGISVFGYVATGWGENDISSLEADILAYHNWYSVNGTYLDQMPNWNYNGPNGTWYYSGPGGVFLPGYMSNLTAYAKSLGMTKVFANSGADIPTDFVGTVDTIGIFENSFTPSIYGYPSLAGATNWHAEYNKNNFMLFSYNTTSIDPYYLMTASDYV